MAIVADFVTKARAAGERLRDKASDPPPPPRPPARPV